MTKTITIWSSEQKDLQLGKRTVPAAFEQWKNNKARWIWRERLLVSSGMPTDTLIKYTGAPRR